LLPGIDSSIDTASCPVHCINGTKLNAYSSLGYGTSSISTLRMDMNFEYPQDMNIILYHGFFTCKPVIMVLLYLPQISFAQQLEIMEGILIKSGSIRTGSV